MTYSLTHSLTQVWAYIFYCLRVGDLLAARRELTSPANMVDGLYRARMIVIIDHLNTIQSRRGSVVAGQDVLDAIDYFRQV